MFDVRHRGKWLPYDAFHAIAADTGLAPAPLLYRGPYHAGLAAELAEGKSILAPSQIREGCVVASADGERKAKYVGESYLLRKEAA